jgi:hypothetical protein
MSLVMRRRLWNFFEALYSQQLNETSLREATPPWIKTPLLPHQQSLLAAARALEATKLDGKPVGPVPGEPDGGRLFASYGILGDRVGSGKSLTALSLCNAPAPVSSYVQFIVRNSCYSDARDVRLIRTKNQLVEDGITMTYLNTCLFIIPHALMSQWESYVSRDTHLNALFIKKRQEATADGLLATIQRHDAVFVSSTMWGSFSNHLPLNTLVWKRVFIDEADTIGINADSSLRALFYWFISASWLNLVFANGAFFNINQTYTALPETPPWVVERVAKLQGANYISIPGCRHLNIVRRMCGVTTQGSTLFLNAVGSQSVHLILQNADEYIHSSFETPTVGHTNIMCATPANIRVLDTFITPEMMERLNAGDLTGALDSIGMSAHSTSEITEAVTASLKRDLENARRTYEYKKGMEYTSEQLKTKALETCETRIASLESRITTITDRIEKAKEQTCPICYCDVQNPAVTPCCQQLFCFPCLCEALKRVAACPLCRTRIADLKEIQVVGTPSESAAESEKPLPEKLPKKDAFVKFVKENPTAKILLFSGYDATFSGLESRLTEENIKHSTVNGSNARINKLLREFNEGNYNVLFLNARNMGTGLNIESASHVVLFHRMAAELESQIIGRAMRLGRKEPLTVVHLLHDTEMSDRISHS